MDAHRGQVLAMQAQRRKNSHLIADLPCSALAVALDVILSLVFDSWFFGARMVRLVIVLFYVPQFAARANTDFDEYPSITCNTSLFIQYFIIAS
jgi:hypothetical protein